MRNVSEDREVLIAGLMLEAVEVRAAGVAVMSILVEKHL